MPNTLPVPSKAALRTLRNLALGTSCTVAFTTGLLTEDRRRRISAAREVHNNAKKLKSSRKYHSGGTPTTESFEDQVMRYRDDGFWHAKDSFGAIEPAQTTLPPEPMIFESADSGYNLQSTVKSLRYEHLRPSRAKRLMRPRLLVEKQRKEPNPQESPEDKSIHRQKKLASDVTRLVQDNRESTNTEAAALRFFDAFEEGLSIESSGLIKELTDAAALLSKAYRQMKDFETCEKILDIVLGYGPIDEEVFDLFDPFAIMENLITGPYDEATGNTVIDVSKLRKAAALYLTKFKAKPREKSRIARDSWWGLGKTICAATCRYELFDLTEALYWRMEQCRGGAPDRSIYYLMTALYKRELYTKFIKAFRRFLTNAVPDKLNFYAMGDMMIESTLKIRRLDIAEEALATLAKMSERGNLRCSRTWFLKVLGSDWRTYRDLSRTQALFERLATHFHLIAKTEVVYGAIIQFCIEAGDEAAARTYYERIEKVNGPLTPPEIRIRGHFAYAKAMRNDWAGVKEDFRITMRLSSMRRMSPETYQYNASFIPIFNLFAKSHPVSETEEFLRTFIDDHDVGLTSYMSTTMINEYAKSKEIDSITRWVDYMISVRSWAGPSFFNAILTSCHKKWKFSFDELYGLYQTVRKLEGPAANFINDVTFSILRRAAIANTGQGVAGTVRNLNRLKLDQPLKVLVDSRSVQENMAVALAKGSPQKALRMYQKAQKSIAPLDTACIATAVEATLQLAPNDICAAASLLRKPQMDGYDISASVAAVFIHQLSHQYNDPSHISVEEIARNTVSALEKRGIAVPVQMITHTTHMLVRQGQYHQAIEFWNSMSRSQNTPTSFNLPTLTILLQAYIGIQDCAGIDWTIQMLSVNRLVPDERFKRYLQIARSGVGDCKYSDRQFLKFLRDALKTVLAMRSQATKEKEDIKAKTIKIMEKAIETQRSANWVVEAEKASKSEVKNWVDERENSSKLPSGGPVEAWMDSDGELDHHVVVPPLGRLVGVYAG